MSQNPSICHCFGPDCGAHVYIGRSRYTTQRAEGRYSFTDAVGDTYTKRILSSTRPTTFTLDFNSKEPAIVQVALEAPAADPRKQQPKEVWVLSTGSTASRPGYGEVWLPAELELVEDRRAGSAVPDAYAEQIYSRFAGAVDTGRDAMILALGRAGSAVPDAYAEQLYIERWEASTYRPMDRPAASRSTTTGDNSEMERVELMGWIDVRTADGWSPCWFELRFPALTYHERPGRPAVAAIADVAALQLEMGPTVEEELGRMFSWRMDTPDKTTDAEAAVRLRLTMAAAIVAGEDSDDAFLLVDEDDTLGAPAAAAVGDDDEDKDEGGRAGAWHCGRWLFSPLAANAPSPSIAAGNAASGTTDHVRPAVAVVSTRNLRGDEGEPSRRMASQTRSIETWPSVSVTK